MSTTQQLLPEDLLIATFYRVGGNVRLKDDTDLTQIFNEAALTEGSPFAPFKVHHLYGYSRLLADTLQTLDHAGSIVRENAAQLYFRPTDHTAGPYGKSLYEQLSPDQKRYVDRVADNLKEKFGGP